MLYTNIYISAVKVRRLYSKSGNIRELLVFANLARRKNSRIWKLSRKLLLLVLPIIEIDNSRILDFAKIPKITDSQQYKHAKITKSTVGDYQ